MKIARRVLYVVILLLGVMGLLVLRNTIRGLEIESELLLTLIPALFVLVMGLWIAFWMMAALWDNSPWQLLSSLSDAILSFFWRARAEVDQQSKS